MLESSSDISVAVVVVSPIAIISQGDTVLSVLPLLMPTTSQFTDSTTPLTITVVPFNNKAILRPLNPLNFWKIPVVQQQSHFSFRSFLHALNSFQQSSSYGCPIL